MRWAAPFALLTLTAAAPLDQTPEQYVRAIYASFDGSADDGALGSRMDRFFSRSMLKLIKKDQAAVDGVDVLDSDPVCDCQDDTGLRLVGLAVTKIDAPHALAKSG